jgi:hypothetical protein
VFARTPLVLRAALCAGVALIYMSGTPLLAATVRTANFDVSAPSADTAGLIARHAEALRSDLSREWLGEKLPDWPERCQVRVDPQHERLVGDTTYKFVRGKATRWQMDLRGPLERIMETLLPHEVLHTILASHFRGTVPRWADEGAALSVEAESDRRRLWALAGRQIVNGPRQPLHVLFDTEQYPSERDALRGFYVHGALVTEFLLFAGKSRFLDFVSTGVREGWDRSAAHHYGFDDLAGLEAAWDVWLRSDRPAIQVADRQTLSDAMRQPQPSTNIAAAENQELPETVSGAGESGGGLSRFGSP